jgi:hypothetical protein
VSEPKSALSTPVQQVLARRFSRIAGTSDGGLLLVGEPDERLGLPLGGEDEEVFLQATWNGVICAV